jgi:VanZ family protein
MEYGLPSIRDKKCLGTLCVVVIAGVLICTLWPFNPFPSNDVSWLTEENGIRFGRHGVVTSKAVLVAEGTGTATSCSLELLLQPADVSGAYTIVNFYSTNNPTQFRVRQWTDGLLISRLSTHKRLRAEKFDVDHAFQKWKSVFLTLASGPKGTVVYLNGRRARILPKFTIDKSDLSGQIVIGNPATNYQPWPGEMRRLAVYSRELSPEDVSRHYEAWIEHGGESSDLTGAIAYYTFAERSGHDIHSAVASGPDLEVPKNFKVPYKELLMSPGKEFEANWKYLIELFTNIVGFVPVGLLIRAYLEVIQSRKHAIVSAIVMGGLLSFVIELLQFYIPRRGSGITDIITNTLGAALGAILARPDWVRIVLLRVDYVTRWRNPAWPAN